MKIGDLNPNPRNPRKISDEKLKMLAASLETFGDLSGFVYNVQTQRLVGGHQRQKVLPPDAEIVSKTVEKTKVGTVAIGHVLIDGEQYPYREVDWDETKEKAANIAANQHGGMWDFPILTEWINDIDSENWPIQTLGFDERELQNLMAPVDFVNKGDENSEWVGMPEFEPGGKYINLIFVFNTELERDEYCKKNNIEIYMKKNNQWIVKK